MQDGAIWPCFRYDRQNTGCSPYSATYNGDHPQNFQTGKGIFSTPVIDGEGTIYIGSADHRFYALRPDGSLKWVFQTNEIIDSAAALPEVIDGKTPSVLVPSGDGNLYCLQCSSGDLIWKFDARISPRFSYNNWWEANVAIGEDGSIYAGNTNFNYYAMHPDGTFKWTYETGANAWSAAAFAQDGTIYWGSNDTFIHAIHPNGKRKWRRRTLGFIAASAAVGSDGTVYIGSFDSYFYALDPENGKILWQFKTQDHIYCSAALSIDSQDRTDAIYFGSADGNLYSVNTNGDLLWRYDTGAPIRSSPVLGRKPEGEQGWIVYFGCGNGSLYALDATSGRRRWSYDTTPDQVELRDRNDLNGSPALGKTGITIGGEHGQIWTIPYDYPIYNDDDRACVDPGEDFAEQMAGLYYVTPGGNIKSNLPDKLTTSTILTFRLMVRENGESLNARLFNIPFIKPPHALQINIDPPINFEAEISADGRYLHIIPRTFLEPDQIYTLDIAGSTYADGIHIGNLTIGGRRLGRFSQQFTFRTESTAVTTSNLEVNRERGTAFELTRFAVPIPTMMPSLNQIGFDYIDWIVGLVQMSESIEDECKLVLWAVGGKRNENGMLVVDPQTDFVLPLSGTYQDGAFILSNHNFTMPITGIPIPFNLFQLRGQFDANMVVGGSATAYADTKVLSIPTFGPLLVLAGLASNWWQKLLAMATFITRPYENGLANQSPEGVTVDTVEFVKPTRQSDGEVVVNIDIDKGISYPLSQHLAGILLIDEQIDEAVPLDYLACIESTADSAGNLQSVTLIIPAKTKLPSAVNAVVMLDVYPLHRQRLA